MNLPDGQAANSSGRTVSIPLNLVEQAVDLDRAQIMKQVVGPPMTEFLRPLYEEPLSQEELARLPNLGSVGNLRTFNLVVRNVLNRRLQQQLELTEDGGFGGQLITLAEIHKGTFFYHTVDSIIGEGMETGVYTTLTVAWQIYSLENNLRRVSDEDPIDFAKFIEVMQRPEFDKILFSLTKGPNGFLGEKATNFEVNDNLLFEFYESCRFRAERPLRIKDAYKLEDDRVVGLSDAYHLAAADKRKRVGERPSSGCPVRHRFEDENGDKQESLIITAKNFLIGAIEAVAERQQLAA